MYYWIKASALHLTTKEEVSKEEKGKKRFLARDTLFFLNHFLWDSSSAPNLSKKKENLQ